MPGDFTLKSPAFADGERIPVKYTRDGANISPPLVWENAPAETRSFVLVVEDPDAPAGVFRHWAIYDLGPESAGLPEGTTRTAETEPLGRGLNDFGNARYDGPAPPRGHGPHRYHFKLAALGTPTLRVEEGASAEDVWKAAQRSAIDQAELVGVYERA